MKFLTPFTLNAIFFNLPKINIIENEIEDLDEYVLRELFDIYKLNKEKAFFVSNSLISAIIRAESINDKNTGAVDL